MVGRLSKIAPLADLDQLSHLNNTGDGDNPIRTVDFPIVCVETRLRFGFTWLNSVDLCVRSLLRIDCTQSTTPLRLTPLRVFLCALLLMICSIFAAGAGP